MLYGLLRGLQHLHVRVPAVRTRPRSPNRGAEDERGAILRNLRKRLRAVQNYEHEPYYQIAQVLRSIIGWIERRTSRTGAKKGGLGRQ